jgi:hypothetical protein
MEQPTEYPSRKKRGSKEEEKLKEIFTLTTSIRAPRSGFDKEAIPITAIPFMKKH